MDAHKSIWHSKMPNCLCSGAHLPLELSTDVGWFFMPLSTLGRQAAGGPCIEAVFNDIEGVCCLLADEATPGCDLSYSNLDAVGHLWGPIYTCH